MLKANLEHKSEAMKKHMNATGWSNLDAANIGAKAGVASSAANIGSKVGVSAAVPPLAIAQSVVDIGAAVANTIANVNDVNKRRQIETALQRMGYADQKALNEKVARASSQNERLSVLVSEINRLQIEQMKSESNKETVTAIVAIAGSFLFLVAMIVISKKQ